MVFVPSCDKAVEVCRELVQSGGVQVITLCPAFTHSEVARIHDAVGDRVPLNVCRTDGPSLMLQYQIVKKAGRYG